MILVAPSEPLTIKTLGKVSSLPEKRGVDLLWVVRGKWCGVQRKEIGDLINSVHDGRLQRELAQMQRLDYRMLLVEGKLQWTMDGELIGKGFGERWTWKQHLGLLWSVQDMGIWVGGSDGMMGTVDAVRAFEKWTGKERHGSLMRRPNVKGMWGTPTSKDFGLHLLMGVDGIGVEMATAIWEKFGGVPWGWTCTEEELMEIRGIGKKKAEKLMGSLKKGEQ